MKNHKNTNRRMVADGIVALVEVSFTVVFWVWVFLDPNDSFIRANADLATLITMITFLCMTFTSEIRQLRIENEILKDGVQDIQSRLLDENAELRKRVEEAQRDIEFYELEWERQESRCRNKVAELNATITVLHYRNRQLKAVLKKHASTSTDDERQES